MILFYISGSETDISNEPESTILYKCTLSIQLVRDYKRFKQCTYISLEGMGLEYPAEENFCKKIEKFASVLYVKFSGDYAFCKKVNFAKDVKRCAIPQKKISANNFLNMIQYID